MSSVVWVVRGRLAERWPGWVAAGLLLGLGFGLGLASFNAARRTTSAYDRILVEARAPDATITHGLSPEEAQRVFGGIDGVVTLRHYIGFIGTIDGVDPALTRVMLGPTGRFPIERPRLRAGRFPSAAARDAVVVNVFLADRAGLTVGQRIDIDLFSPPEFSTSTRVSVTVAGIGTFAREAVVDETAGSGIVVFSPAFTAAHRDLAAYTNTSVDLAPGIDARRDFAPRVGALGGGLSEARSQETQAVSDALGPMVTILIVLGVLTFIATSIAAVQVMQRDQDAWRVANETMRTLGMTRGQLVVVLLATPVVLAVAAIPTALMVMAATSPLAPFGPLHDLDPGRGVVIDPVVASLGVAAILLILGAASGLILARRSTDRVAPTRVRTLGMVASRPAAAAGLALGAGPGRRRLRRLTAFASVAITLVALVTTLVVSAVALSGTPSRYGFDWDVLAVNPYGDQTVEGLRATFGEDRDVAAATGFTSAGLLIDGSAVPGLAATAVKGELGPTIVEGRALRAPDEIVLGRDSLERLGVEIGDHVEVQVAGSADGGTGGRAKASVLRVVGVATFPSVIQIGTDQPRLGTGALVTRSALDRMLGSSDNDPEWTTVRLAPGATPRALIARNPDGVPDAAGFATTWFTDAKPSELRQLDAVRSLLLGAIAISVLVAVAVIGYGLWAQTRASRRDLATLAAVGFTRRQLGTTAAWQAVPLALIVTVVGVPLGIALGRFGFGVFARSLAVVDRAAMPAWVVAALVACALAVSAFGAGCAASAARRTRVGAVLRHE